MKFRNVLHCRVTLPVFTALILSQIGSAQGGLTVNPQQVSMAASTGTTVPVFRSVGVASATPGESFSATVRYLIPSPDWLSVSPATGTLPATVTLKGDPTNLPPGTYVAQLTVTAGTSGGLANVFFTVGPTSTTSPIVASPSSLTFFDNSGIATTLSQNIDVKSATGSGPVSYLASASSDANWLTVSPLPATTPGSVAVFATTSNLASGVYSGSVMLTPPAGDPIIIPVSLSTAGTGAGLTLALSQTSVTINYQTGVAVPPAQTVQVTTGNAYRQYTAATTAPWLALSTYTQPQALSITDVTPGQFFISVKPDGLAQVSPPYATDITVSSSGLASQTLHVVVNVVGQPALNATPASVRLSDTSVLQQYVVVTGTGSTNLAFAATVSSGSSWLTVSPTTGITGTGAYLVVSANTTGLAADTYRGTITITVPGGSSTIQVPVQLDVSGGSATDTLDISADSIELDGIVGTTNPVASFTVDSSAASTTHKFSVAASSNEGWLSVDPFTATTPAVINATANLAAVPSPGSYQGKITVTSLLTGAVTNIPVTFVLSARGITASPTSLSYTQSATGASVPTQTLSITANVPSTVKVSSAPSWVTVTPTSGQAPLTLTVAVDPTGLPVGTTSGNILLTGPDNQLTIPVSLVIPPPPGPTVTPASISLSYQLGDPVPAPTTISIDSVQGPASFTATATTDSGVNWLLASPSSGTTPGAITATLDPSLFVPGNQTGTITVTLANGSSQQIPVSVKVTASPLAVDAVVQGASFAPTPIAPGLIVTITGTGLGPVTGVSARPSAAGAFPTELAGTQVLFDGVAAPLLFVRIDQVNAIVPYAMFGRLSAHLQVETGSSLSVPIEIKVVDAVPGLFTASGSGAGQAAALNLDMTPNSPANPSDRGSIITVYGTGEGQTDPPGQDGRVITTDLRHPLLPYSATIGGLPADVTYFGSAPGLVSGVFQANIRIPADVQPGAVPIQIQVGTGKSSSSVTIFVR